MSWGRKTSQVRCAAFPPTATSCLYGIGRCAKVKGLELLAGRAKLPHGLSDGSSCRRVCAEGARGTESVGRTAEPEQVRTAAWALCLCPLPMLQHTNMRRKPHCSLASCWKGRSVFVFSSPDTEYSLFSHPQALHSRVGRLTLH